MPPVASDIIPSTPHGGLTPRTYKASKAKNVNLLSQPLKIGHQRVNIDVDLSKNHISGLTELTVIPSISNLKSIKLDCREMQIKEILINNRQVNFIHKDLLYINDEKYFDRCVRKQRINIYDIYNKNITIHQHHILRQKLNYVFGTLDENVETNHGNTEELTILVPDNLKLHRQAGTGTPGSHPNTATPLHLKSRNTYTESYSPIQVKIEYIVKNPKNGVRFITDLDLAPVENWHAYTTNSEYNISTSSWVPCIDNLWERSTWTVDVNIPRTIKDIGHSIIIGTKEAAELRKLEYKRRKREERNKRRQALHLHGGHDDDNDDEEEDEDEDDEEEEQKALVVTTGDHVETKETPHPTDLSKKTVLWSIFNPVCAHHIGWAVGCFESVNLPEEEAEDDVADDDADSSLKEISCPVKVYCLPGQQLMAKNTCVFLGRAVNYFLKEFGSFPFNSYSVVFLHGLSVPLSNFAGITLINDSWLYPPNIIEPIYPTTELVVDAVASQWSGINIVPQKFNDMWCTIGIARFMALQFLRVLFGTNEMKFRIKRYMSEIVQLDIDQKPLALWNFRYPISENDLYFIKRKSPMVLFILDRRMTKTDKSFGLSRVLPKLFLQAMSGDLVNNTLSTPHFQYLCEKVNRNRLENFFKQWVFGSGTPVFNVSQRFNRKRGMIEVAVRQVQTQLYKGAAPNTKTFLDSSVSLLEDEPVPKVQNAFLGPMTIRVHEADGIPYEHIVELKDSAVKLDINYNSKFRRMKKHKEDAAEGGTYSRFGDIIQSPAELAEWGLEDWGPIDDEELYNNAFEWLRVDTDFEWIARTHVRQPDYMYCSQLQYDRDVEAQYDAIMFFGNLDKPTLPYCTSLVRTLMDERYFYGVRVAAAEALAKIARPDNNFMSLKYLIRAYTKLFCFPDSTIPLANDFSNISKFLMQREFPRIFCTIRDENGNVPYSVKDILLNLVIYNENSNNSFEDSMYMSTLVEALAGSIISRSQNIIMNLTSPVKLDEELEPREKEFIEAVVEEINRQQKLDELMPSYHGILSKTCFRQKIRLARYGLLTLPFEALLQYTSSSHVNEIRLEAFKGLLLLGGLKNSFVMKYFLKTCLLEYKDDKFRSELVNLLVECVSIAAVEGTASTLDDPEFQTLEKYYGSGGATAGTDSNLIVVEANQSGTNSRRDILARATLKGTIQLLRRDYSIGKGLRYVFWELLHSSLISLYDRRNVFSICQVLYKETDSFVVDLDIPCVPLNELNKKIVAKSVGEGVISIRRGGRFKIQIATKLNLGNKPKINMKISNPTPAPTEPAVVPPMRAPRQRVEPVKPPVEVIPDSPIVTEKKGLVKFKLGKRLKEARLRNSTPTPAPMSSNGVEIDGTTITIPVALPPLRYVRIKNGVVLVSRKEFEIVQVKREPKVNGKEAATESAVKEEPQESEEVPFQEPESVPETVSGPETATQPETVPESVPESTEPVPEPVSEPVQEENNSDNKDADENNDKRDNGKRVHEDEATQAKKQKTAPKIKLKLSLK